MTFKIPQKIVLSIILFNVLYSPIAYSEEKAIDITVKKGSSIADPYMKAINSFNKGDYFKSIEEFNKLIKQDNKDSEIYNYRGLAYYNLAKSTDFKSTFDEAETKIVMNYLINSIKDYFEALKIDDKKAEFYNNFAMSTIKLINISDKSILAKTQEINKSFEIYKNILGKEIELLEKNKKEFEKKVKDLNLNKIQGLNTIDKALKNSLELEPNNANTYNIYTYYYMAKEDYKSAEESIQKAITLNENNDIFYNTLGILYMSLDKDKLSKEAFDKAIELNRNSEANKNLIVLYLKKENYKLAINSLNNLIINNPEDKTLKDLYINSNFLNKEKDTINNLKSQILKYPNNRIFKNILSEVYKIEGAKNVFSQDPEKAVSYLRESLKLDPNNEKIKGMLNLAYTQMANSYKNKGHLNKAEDVYKSMLKENPNDGLAIVSLASIYKKQKKYDSAISLNELRLKTYPKFAPIHYELAKLYSLKNDKVNSIKYLRNSLLFDTKFKSQARIEQDLKNIMNEKDFKLLVR